MSRVIGALVLLSSLAAAGCPASCQNNVPTGDEVADCAAESGKDIFHTLLPRVNTVLAAGPSYEMVAIELSKLVGQYGIEVVTCVVETVRSRNEAAAAAATGDEKQLHERQAVWAAKWVEEEGATIQSP